MKKSIFLFALSVMITASGFRSGGSNDAQLYPGLDKFFSSAKKKFSSISREREAELQKVAQLIAKKRSKSKPANIVFVSRSNSGSDVVAQAFLQSALVFYGVRKVKSFSAGQSSSEMDSRVIDHLTKDGFKSTG